MSRRRSNGSWDVTQRVRTHSTVCYAASVWSTCIVWLPKESESVSKNHDGWKRGIRIGSAKDGSVKAFIPDPVEKSNTTSAAEGVAADAAGNIYGAEVGPKRMMKYVRK